MIMQRDRQTRELSFKARWYADKLAKKCAKGLRGYPLATMAFYGPDATRATKVVVGIIGSVGLHPDAIEKWFSENADVRADAQVTEAVVRFIEAHGAKSVVATDRIIGCPHEEGVDYPQGAKCPQCAYWATHDRWSGEAIE